MTLLGYGEETQNPEVRFKMQKKKKKEFDQKEALKAEHKFPKNEATIS